MRSTLGPRAFIERARSVYQRTMGSVLSPFNAFLLLQGIETVALRMERHVENARKVAAFLKDDPRVAWVNYAGFAESPYFDLVQKYLKGRAPSLFTFGIKGGLDAGKEFYDSLEVGYAARQYRGCQITRLPPGFDHSSADVSGGATSSRRFSRDYPTVDRHRAHRRYNCGSRSSTCACVQAQARYLGNRMRRRIHIKNLLRRTHSITIRRTPI